MSGESLGDYLASLPEIGDVGDHLLACPNPDARHGVEFRTRSGFVVEAEKRADGRLWPVGHQPTLRAVDDIAGSDR